MRNHTSRKCEAHLVGYRIDSPEEAAATEPCFSPDLIDMNLAKSGEIDHQAIVASARPGQAVSAAANGGCYTRCVRVAISGLNVSDIEAGSQLGWLAMVHPVPHGSCFGVTRVARP